ncbi:MAG: 1-acyl-sn-glycerol-3-phosphate acyltransferase [Proteobacteria bacterium]|nr:1-acyl-sn-glycerol-3-phosphate acyltransferase [Pseudomonadota bacterium]
MIILRSLLFNMLFFGYTAWTALWLAPRLLARDADIKPGVKRWAGGVLWLLDHVAGITYALRGVDHIPEGGVLIAAKHQSAWDTMMFHLFVSRSIYVTKQEVTRIPFYGAVARGIGSISIDRRGGAKALKGMIRDCRAALEDGHQVIIFPEGTRTAPGTRLPYQPGVAAIYKLGFPVVPVALNSGLFWGRRSFIKRPGRIVVQFLPAIQPGLDRKAFLAELERRVEEATAALIAEAVEADDDLSPHSPSQTLVEPGDKVE